MLETFEKSRSFEQLRVKQSKLLNATINISGYRHSSNLLISAAIVLPFSDIRLLNVPNLLDTDVMVEIMNVLGAKCEFNTDKNEVFVNTAHLFNHHVPNELSKQLHGSLYLMPALLARFGKCVFGESGGCQIGQKQSGFERPVNHVLDIMERFSVKVHHEGSNIIAEALTLKAAVININDYSHSKTEVTGPLTSGATKTAILLALAVKVGKTTLLNPFLKSETIDLLDFVKKVGYRVFYNSSRIEIEYQVPNKNVSHQVISDPSEIITYMSIAGFHDIQLCLTNITLDRTLPILKPELDLLHKIGVSHTVEHPNILVKSTKKMKAQSIAISVAGVCTDHHPLLIPLLLKAQGKSDITENVWHDRFNYIAEANKFGLNLKQNNNSIIIDPIPLQKAQDHIICPDLRAAALLLILAIGAPGVTTITNFHHLFRGYVDFIKNLQSMGADMEIYKNEMEL